MGSAYILERIGSFSPRLYFSIVVVSLYLVKIAASVNRMLYPSMVSVPCLMLSISSRAVACLSVSENAAVSSRWNCLQV